VTDRPTIITLCTASVLYRQVVVYVHGNIYAQRYALPVFWMTSRFHMMVLYGDAARIFLGGERTAQEPKPLYRLRSNFSQATNYKYCTYRGSCTGGEVFHLRFPGVLFLLSSYYTVLLAPTRGGSSTTTLGTTRGAPGEKSL